MTRHNATGTATARDPLPVVFELMQALATSVLNEHTDKSGRYMVRGSTWSCKRVVVATDNLAMIYDPKTGRTGDAGTPTPVASSAIHKTSTVML